MKAIVIFACQFQCRDANAEMPIPRFPNVRFPGFCQFCMEKEEFAENIVCFFILFNAYQTF